MGDLLQSSSLEGLKLKEFWSQLLAGPVEGRNEFLMIHLALVQHVARRLRRRLPGQVELEDLVQVGLIGLHNAMLAYDPARGVKFSTFAPFYVRGAILDHLRQVDWMPRLVRKRVTLMQKAIHGLQQRLGRNPSEQEVESYFNLPPKEYRRLFRDGRAVAQYSLSPAKSDESSEPFPATIQADHRAPDPVREAHRKLLKDALTRGLSQSERLVVVLYYYEEMTMKEIGQSLDLCESRVSQIHKSVMKRLKASLAGQVDKMEPPK